MDPKLFSTASVKNWLSKFMEQDIVKKFEENYADVNIDDNDDSTPVFIPSLLLTPLFASDEPVSMDDLRKIYTRFLLQLREEYIIQQHVIQLISNHISSLISKISSLIQQEAKNVLKIFLYNYYYQNMAKHYGAKSQLCTIHLHLHLKVQLLKYGSLSLTSCFPREDYLRNSLKWCQVKKYVLEQFIPWYLVDRTLRRTNELSINDLFFAENFDERYLNNKIIQTYEDKLTACLMKKNVDPTRTTIIYYARYCRGVRKFHCRAYARRGDTISYYVSISNPTCSAQRTTYFDEVLYYLQMSGSYYALIKKYDCMEY
ncbi:unnamed protein product [Didymodactylos carnosus]|uniref:Uncharacterized protein n=1 Tax=Didymodactylos carnosus TaxID=1234261 RepID=A0A814YI24_9BILA|nr:unnamed protein product [Didymodactylos carnosus]CAF3991962.1 unnamed protein product [Didymodactylos carnosus]